MHVTSGAPCLTFRDEGEAAAFARLFREALNLAYGVRRAEVPYLLRTARDGLNASFGATRGNIYAQFNGPSGPSGAAPAHDRPRSYEPVRLKVKEAARLAEVHPRTVGKWIERRQVEAVPGPRGSYLVDVGSLTAKIISRSRKDGGE